MWSPFDLERIKTLTHGFTLIDKNGPLKRRFSGFEERYVHPAWLFVFVASDFRNCDRLCGLEKQYFENWLFFTFHFWVCAFVDYWRMTISKPKWAYWTTEFHSVKFIHSYQLCISSTDISQSIYWKTCSYFFIHCHIGGKQTPEVKFPGQPRSVFGGHFKISCIVGLGL